MSGRSGGFTITFKAVDGATTTIQSVNKQLAGLAKPIEQFNAASKSMGGASGLNSLTSSMKGLSVSTVDVFRGMSQVVPVLGLITSAGSLAGMAQLAKSWAETGFAVDVAAKKIGIAAGTLAQLQGASRLAGLSTEAMSEALGNLATHMRDALGGRDRGALSMMTLLFGPNAEAEMKKTADQLLPDIADKIRAIKNPQDQQRAADALGVGGLFPLLIKGGDEIRKLMAEGQKLNPINQGMIDRASELNRSYAKLKEAISGVYSTMGDDLAKWLPHYLDETTEWVASNRRLVASITEIGAAVGVLVAMKPAAWVLRLLGLGSLIPSAATVGAAVSLGLTGPAGGQATPAETEAVTRRLREQGLLGDPDTGISGWIRRQLGWAVPNGGVAGPRAPLPRGAPSPAIPYAAGSILGHVGATQSQYEAFREGVAQIEHARYNQMGGSSNRFAGRYQMGQKEIELAAKRLFEPVPTREQFLNDPKMQERYFEAYTDWHHQYLMENSPEYRALSPEKRLAALGYAHNQGQGGAAEWLRTGQVGRDAFHTAGTAYSDEVMRRLASANGAGGPAAIPLPGGPDIAPQGRAGHVQVDVHIRGPAGTSATTKAHGAVVAPPAKVEVPMDGYGALP